MREHLNNLLGCLSKCRTLLKLGCPDAADEQLQDARRHVLRMQELYSPTNVSRDVLVAEEWSGDMRSPA